MKTRLVLTAFSCWCFTMCTTSTPQKQEILLVGTLHHIPDSLSCNWQATYEKLLRYQPDQISGEYVAPTDSISLIYWAGKHYRRQWDSLILAWEGKKINPHDSVQYYVSRVQQKDDAINRMYLWKYYNLALDAQNQDYQLYLVLQQMKKGLFTPDTTTATGKQFFSAKRSWSRMGDLGGTRPTNEYYNLVFPLAKAMNIEYIYPSDYRHTYTAQSLAYGRFADGLANTPHIKKLEDAWKDFLKDDSMQMANCNILSLVNSTAWREKSDYVQAKVLLYTHNTDYLAYADVWYKRNKMIAENIIAAVTKSNARRMAVFYGDMHIFPVKKFLEERGYTVKTLDQLQ